MWVRELALTSRRTVPWKGNIMSNANTNDNAAVFARIAELEAMQAELKALKAKTANMPRLKVSKKGAISVYGLQRMPVTLYAGQWERIAELVNDGTLGAFIAANEANLTRKGEEPLAKPAVTESQPALKATKKPKRSSKSGPTAADLAAIERQSLGFDVE